MLVMCGCVRVLVKGTKRKYDEFDHFDRGVQMRYDEIDVGVCVREIYSKVCVRTHASAIALSGCWLVVCEIGCAQK